MRGLRCHPGNEGASLRRLGCSNINRQCRQGETQSCAPNQPNQIHTTPDTELRRSRTKPKADLLYLVQQATDTSSIFSNQTSNQSLSPKLSEPNPIITLILSSLQTN